MLDYLLFNRYTVSTNPPVITTPPSIHQNTPQKLPPVVSSAVTGTAADADDDGVEDESGAIDPSGVALGVVLVSELTAELAAGLAVGPTVELAAGLAVGPTVELAAGLAVGPTVELAAGLAVVLPVGLAVGLAVGTGVSFTVKSALCTSLPFPATTRNVPGFISGIIKVVLYAPSFPASTGLI